LGFRLPLITGYHQLKGKYDVRLRNSLTTVEGLELGSLFSDRVCGATHRIATYRIVGYNSRVSSGSATETGALQTPSVDCCRYQERHKSDAPQPAIHCRYVAVSTRVFSRATSSANIRVVFLHSSFSYPSVFSFVGSFPSGIVASHSFHCYIAVSPCVSGDLL